MWDQFDIWKFIAGLGLFLFGMFMLEEGIKALSGRAFKKFLRKHTKNKIKAILSGTLITAIVQSSSVVSLMTLAFVGAGVIKLSNAIGIILGSNLGTTITGWIVVTLGFKVDIESFALPCVGLGGLGLIFLAKSERFSNISKLVVGFGFLFLGLDYMKLSISGLAETFDMSLYADYGLFVFALIGLVLTAIIQSSSATMVITLSALSAGIINFEMAAAIVVGADLGTTVTVLIGGLGKTLSKRQVAFSHFFFNVIVATIGFVFLYGFIALVKDVIGIEDGLMGLVAFHTSINLVGVILFFPFVGLFAKLLKRMFKEKSTSTSNFINKVSIKVPEAALTALRDETLSIIKKTVRLNVKGMGIKDKELIKKLAITDRHNLLWMPLENYEDLYNSLKQLEGEMIKYYVGIQKLKLVNDESEYLNQLIVSIRNSSLSAKSIKDIRHNLIDFSGAVDGFLHDQYKNLLARQVRFYTEYYRVLSRIDESTTLEEVIDLFVLIKELDHEFLINVYSEMENRKFSEVAVSSLFNANREVYDSNKAMVMALESVAVFGKIGEQFKHN